MLTSVQATRLRKLIVQAIAAYGVLFSPLCAARADIKACASSVQYPPFFSYGSGGTRQEGLASDLISKASALIGTRIVVQVLPWRRCLKLAELGVVDIVLNVPTAQIDPEPYLISEAYAQLESTYFVSRKHWPDGIPIKNVQDLKAYRICGLSGYTYDSYGLRNHPVDTGTSSYVSLTEKLHMGRCDLFVEKRDVVAGLARMDGALRSLFSSPDLILTTLPEDSPVGLHFAISRQSARSEALLKVLNDAIAQR